MIRGNSDGTRAFATSSSGRGATRNIGEAVAGRWETIGLKVKRRITDFAGMKTLHANRTTSGTAYVFVAGK
jgi:hypothetical protein